MSTTGMKVISSYARFTGNWSVEVQIEPGSVPDQPMAYSCIGAFYRPCRLRLSFTTAAKEGNTAALRLENGSGFMKQAAESVSVSSVSVYGPRVKKDGAAGEFVVEEGFYGLGQAPEWVQEAVREHLQALGGQS